MGSHHKSKISSLVAVQEKKWIIGKTFNDRIWSMQKDRLTMSTNERFKFQIVTIKHGYAWEGVQNGLQVEDINGRIYRSLAPSKTQWAMWLQAFQNLIPVKGTPASPTKVKFHSHFRVRTIPAFDDLDDEEDMYSATSSEDDEQAVVFA